MANLWGDAGGEKPVPRKSDMHLPQGDKLNRATLQGHPQLKVPAPRRQSDRAGILRAPLLLREEGHPRALLPCPRSSWRPPQLCDSTVLKPVMSVS
jgi:hypothetical protein